MTSLRKRTWTPAPIGCDRNPGVWDTGNGAIMTHEVCADYPGVTRVTIESYCGRDADNCRYYTLAHLPGVYTSPQQAFRVFAVTSPVLP